MRRFIVKPVIDEYALAVRHCKRFGVLYVAKLTCVGLGLWLGTKKGVGAIFAPTPLMLMVELQLEGVPQAQNNAAIATVGAPLIEEVR